MDNENNGQEGRAVVLAEQVEEIDRQARAYGWEIGRGAPMTQQLEHLSNDNPFLSETWRETFIRHGDQSQEESSLVTHAKKELELIGEDEDTIRGYLRVIQAFADMGHSGMSAAVGTHVINELLQYKNLTPITDNPDDWMYHGPDIAGTPKGIWQSARNPAIFSRDGGKTYYDQNEDVTNKDDYTQYVSEKHEA